MNDLPEVRSLDHPGDAVHERDAAAALDLSLYFRMYVGDVYSEEDRRDGRALGEAGCDVPGLIVLAIDAHNDLAVAHEAVGPAD